MLIGLRCWVGPSHCWFVLLHVLFCYRWSLAIWATDGPQDVMPLLRKCSPCSVFLVPTNCIAAMAIKYFLYPYCYVHSTILHPTWILVIEGPHNPTTIHTVPKPTNSSQQSYRDARVRHVIQTKSKKPTELTSQQIYLESHLWWKPPYRSNRDNWLTKRINLNTGS